MPAWGFYGRSDEQVKMREMLLRGRWFFAKVTGRRRIGKTALIQRALEGQTDRQVFYLQVPDSGPAGLLSQVLDALDIFQVPREPFPRPRTLAELARLIGAMARAGYLVALDQFQYFNRERLRDFCSLLQIEVDSLAADAERVKGGLIVLGSLHTEIAALLEDRAAPLYNRTTDELALGHLDIGSVVEILKAHAEPDPERLLFLWSLFEGVPKFYRDCFEQGVLAAPHREILERVFFAGSSPLRTEADNWFLKELHGRYDVVLKFLARNPGAANGDLTEHIRQISPDTIEQVGGYLKVLGDRYRLIERRLPVFAKSKAKRGRYYLTDNFLKAWLGALAGPASSLSFRPLEQVVSLAEQRMMDVEGGAFEKLVATLYEERSRKQVGDFPLSARVQGYWDGGQTEIDLVAFAESERRVRFGTCRRSAERLFNDRQSFAEHVERFLDAFPEYRGWKVERVALAPVIPAEVRKQLERLGYLPQDLNDLVAGL